MSTTTIGIDLASKPRNTGFCAIRWGGPAPVLTHLGRGKSAQDGVILHDKFLANSLFGMYKGFEDAPITKVGIDAPFGWPKRFVGLLAGDARCRPTLDELADRGKLNSFELRHTDIETWNATGKKPLSVSTDRIAYAAIRCTAILGHLTEHGVNVNRDGSGLVCEVYPDAALRRWTAGAPDGLAAGKSYKGPTRTQIRAAITGILADGAGLSDPHGLLQLAADSDDCLDALASALVARDVEQRQKASPRRSVVPSDAPAHLVAEEGWIHLPELGLSQLRG